MASVIRSYGDSRLAWAHSDIFSAGLDPFTLAVYMNLASRADTNGKAWPKQSTIADDCQMSERQVRRCVEKLIEARLLIIIEQPGSMGGRRVIYHLASRNEWVAAALSGEQQPASESGSMTSNRTVTTGQPASESGSLYTRIRSNELDPKAGDWIIPEVSEPKAKKTPKTPKAKAVNPKTFLADFPAEFRQDDAFVEAWTNWGDMRNDLKKPLTPQAAKLAIKSLTKVPVAIAVKALEKSTISNWTGVFPESVTNGPGSSKFSAASSAQPAIDFGF